MKLDLDRTIATLLGSAVTGGAIGFALLGDGKHVHVFAVVFVVIGFFVTYKAQKREHERNSDRS